jgi:hypothetical protein
VPQVHYLEAIPDIGTPQELQELRDRIAITLSVDEQVGSLLTRSNQTYAVVYARIKPLLTTIWNAAALGSVTNERASAIWRAAADPTYLSYTDARWIADNWMGVQVQGTSARAIVIGHAEYLTEGTWNPAQHIQMQILMTQTLTGQWMLNSVEGVPADGQG